MKNLRLLAFSFLLMPGSAAAQSMFNPCTQIPGALYNSCQAVSASAPLPVAAFPPAGTPSGYVLTSNGGGVKATWQAGGGGSSPFQSLTTTGTSGAATLIAGVLNIPVYSGGGGGTVTLGTSAAATNPQRSGEAATGLYSLNSGEVDLGVLTTGAIDKWTSAGENLVAGAYQIKGLNGLSFPTADTTSGGSIAIGPGALAGETVSGSYGNIGIGYQALNTTMTTAAANNVALGAQSLKAVTSGSANMGIGTGAGISLTTGQQNVMIGQNAAPSLQGGVQNVAIGGNGSTSFAALAANVNGNYNTAIGPFALGRTTSNNNTGIGVGAGATITSGANNTVIGYNVGATTMATGSNNIVIGTNAGVDVPAATSSALNIGNLITGDMTNVSSTAGTGNLTTLFLQSTASGVNYFQITGASSGGQPVLQAAGSDSNVGFNISAKNNGVGYIYANGGGLALHADNSGISMNANTTVLTHGGYNSWNWGTETTYRVDGYGISPNYNPKFQVYLNSGNPDTNIQAGNNAQLVQFSGAGTTRQHQTGALALQTDFVMIPTALESFVGASTATDMATFGILGFKGCGTNCTATNVSGMLVPTGAIAGTVTNGYGINVSAPTGATNNFAAKLTGNTQLNGGVLYKRRTLTTGSSDTATSTDYAIYWNKTTGSASAEVLPACATANDGQVFVVADEKGDAATNNITVTATSSTVNSGASYVMNSAHQAAILGCDASTTNYVLQ